MGHIKRSLGAWALSPFSIAAAPKVANQAATVSLGRPGAGEELLAQFGFDSPSSRARRRAIAMASSADTCSISSTSSGSHSGGMNPIPIPSIRFDPVSPPERTADSAGSTATTRNPDLRTRSAFATP